MNNNVNLKNICETFLQIEKDSNLLDLEIQGVKVWQYWRTEIYHSILKGKGLLEEIHPDLAKQSILDKFIIHLNTIKNSILHNPFYFKEEVDTIVIPHQRVMKIENNYIDIHTNSIIEELKANNSKYLIIEKPYLGKHLSKPNKNKKYIENINLRAFINRQFLSLKLTEEELKQLNELNTLIIKHFSIDLGLNTLFIKLIKRFKTKYDLYKKLLSNLKPKKIYLTINYSNCELIKAAKDLGIETIEIQHGAISDYHMGYSYPHADIEIDYFPAKFYSWGEYWSETTKLPLKAENIVNYGFKNFRNSKNIYDSTKKIQNQIVVISQGGISKSLSLLILKHIEFLKDYNIIYKLHPSEFNSTNNSLEKLFQFSNVHIAKDEDLYKILAESKYIIGSYSTAIYEGIAFGCIPILANLSGIESMDFLKEKYAIPIFDEDSNINPILNTALELDIDPNYFF